MTHWGWYWKVKKNHKRKRTCGQFMSLDSFEMFKNKEGVEACRNKVAYEIPQYGLKAFLLSNDNYRVEYSGGSYLMPVEKQPCHFGGFRYFFHCPLCDKRMRKLYCKDGVFLCRKCLNLGYFTQILRPPERCLIMARKIKQKLEDMAGDLDRKPPWIKRKTFERLKDKHHEYRETKWRMAKDKELEEMYPELADWL